MNRTARILIVILLLGSLVLTGCGAQEKPSTAAKPTPEGQSQPATQQGGQPAGQQGGVTATSGAPAPLPGAIDALRGALAESSPLRYVIMTADTPAGADKTAYLDALLDSKGTPGQNELWLVIFPLDNHDIRFAMGALMFEKKVSVETMLGLVRTHYLPKAREQDPAGGLAALIQATNQMVR